jgi:hypothetical protein
MTLLSFVDGAKTTNCPAGGRANVFIHGGEKDALFATAPSGSEAGAKQGDADDDEWDANDGANNGQADNDANENEHQPNHGGHETSDEFNDEEYKVENGFEWPQDHVQ